MVEWSSQDAKNRFSAVVNAALEWPEGFCWAISHGPDIAPYTPNAITTTKPS